MITIKKYQPTVSLFLNTKARKQSGKCPVKLVIYCNGKKKRFNTRIDVTAVEWTMIHQLSVKEKKLKEIKVKLNAVTTKAEEILKKLIPFSFQRFHDAFYENATNLTSVSIVPLFEAYKQRHEQLGNVGTAISYQTTLNSIQSFKKNLTLHDITPHFLQEYETFMYSKGKSPSTVGIYLRSLRAVYNDAISKQLIPREEYPFGRSKYIIPASRNIKKAIPFEDIIRLLEYIPENELEAQGHDYWTFSYTSNGMNFCDIAKLKHEDIHGTFLYYIRSKTKNTKKSNQNFIKVPLHNKAIEIINRRKRTGGVYLFPILTEDMTPLQVKYKIQDFIKDNNHAMELIRRKLSITTKLNTYAARHSFATVLKRKNVSTEFISESLGHSSLSTTAAYLDSFEDHTKIEISNLLTTP